MRTDDFQDDITPEDTNEPRPDKAIDVDSGTEDFNEFDHPATTGGSSLGDVWRNNPLVKIAVIAIGGILLVSAYLVFGGHGDDAPKSTLAQGIRENTPPGGAASQTYNQAVEDENQARLNTALQTGTSTIPIPTQGDAVTQMPAPQEEPPVQINDPLQTLRGQLQQPVQDQSTPQLEQPAQQGQQPAQGQVYQPQAAVVGPDPQAVDALAQAMGQQMTTILGKHQIKGPQVMAVTSADYLEKKAQDAAKNQTVLEADSTTQNDDVEEILIPAGTIVYAQTLTEANSDVPGPVLARISSGPLTGSRVLGSFQRADEKLILQFNQVVIKGVSYPVQGVALDPKTTLPGVATDVDHRYWKRFVYPAAASFISGMADAISNREQTNVSVNGSTVTSSKPKLDTKEQLAAGLSEGTDNLSEELDNQGNSVQPLVRVHAGTPVGILFTSPVIKPKDQQ